MQFCSAVPVNFVSLFCQFGFCFRRFVLQAQRGNHRARGRRILRCSGARSNPPSSTSGPGRRRSIEPPNPSRATVLLPTPLLPAAGLICIVLEGSTTNTRSLATYPHDSLPRTFIIQYIMAFYLLFIHIITLHSIHICAFHIF
jgi:hypothetical protein